MEAIPEQMPGTSIVIPSNGYLSSPPLQSLPRSMTGRKPQRSSPLAGPAVSVTDSEDVPSRLRVSSSPNPNHDCNSLSSPTLRPNVFSRPPRSKSMYSIPSSNSQSLTPPDRLPASDTQRLIRPISAMSAAQEHSFSQNSGWSQTAGEFRSEQIQSRYRHVPPLTRTTSKQSSPSTRLLNPPIILINEQSIEVPQIPIPPPAKSTSRITETTFPRDTNSWYTTNAYGETPRFSRLGLAAGNVVMPVTAKEYKKCQQQHQERAGCSSGNRSLYHSPSVNSVGSLATNSSSSNKGPSLIGSLASTLKLSRSKTRISDHQQPSSPWEPDPSLPASTTFPDSDSSPATSTTSTLFPDSSLSRTRTNSFTDSSSTFTYFVPDIVTSSSRTSINEEMLKESSSTIAHGKDIQEAGKHFKVRNKSLLVSKAKRRTVAPGTLPETKGNKGVVDKDEKSRRGSMFRRVMGFFVSS